MSVVTNILLIHGLSESDDDDETFKALEPIQEYLHSEHKSQLNHLNGHEGGGKHWEVEVWGGAFNKLDMFDLMDIIRRSPWVDRTAVQLMIMEEDDTGFTVFNLDTNLDFWNRETYIGIPGRQHLPIDSSDS